MKKLLIFLLAASIANPLYAGWKKTEKPLMVATDYSTYQAELMRNSENQFRKTWYITNTKTGDQIGDESSEANLFKQLALTATVARHTALSPNLPYHLSGMKSNFENIIRGYNAVQAAEITMRYSSQLEGMLAPSLVAAGSTTVSSIKTMAKRVVAKYSMDLARNIYVRDNETEIEKGRIKLLKAEKLSLKELELASERLGNASQILQSHKQPWNYSQAAEFYKNWRDGMVYGLANAGLLANDIDPVTSYKLGKILSINTLNGIGIPLEILERIPNVHRYQTRQDLEHLPNKLARRLEESSAIFSDIEGYFIDIEQPINPSLPNITEYTKESNRSELLPKWLPDDVMLSRGERKCYGLVIENQTGNKDFKSLEVIIDDISPLNKKGMQVLEMKATAAPNIKYFKGLYRHDTPRLKIDDAVCIEANQSAQPNDYTLNYTFKFQDTSGNKMPARHFVKTVKVN